MVVEFKSKALGDKFIELVAQADPDIAKLIQKARDIDISVQEIIEDIEYSGEDFKCLLQIIGCRIPINEKILQDIIVSFKNIISKDEVDAIIKQSNVKEVKSITFEEKLQMISKQHEKNREVMKFFLHELKVKESIIIRQRYSTMNESGDVIGNFVFGNVHEMKQAAKIFITTYNEAGLLVNYDPIFLKKGKEHILEIDFNLKMVDNTTKLEFKTVFSKLYIAIECALINAGKLSDLEYSILESFKNKYLITEFFEIPEDPGVDVIIEV